MEETENKLEDKAGEAETSDKDEASTEDASAKKEKEEISPLDRADAANKETARLLEERKKIVTREEKLHAAQMVGGSAEAGGEQKTILTPEEKAAREKIKQVGMAAGAAWAKKMEDEDNKE